MTTPQYHIPDEILINIFTHLAPGPGRTCCPEDDALSLATLARACRATRSLRRVAEPLLYRRIKHVSPKFIEGALCSPDRGRELAQLVQSIESGGWDWEMTTSQGARRLYHGRVRGILQERHGVGSVGLVRLLDRIFGPGVAHDAGTDEEADDEDGDDDEDDHSQAGEGEDYLAECAMTLPLTLILCLTTNVVDISLSTAALDVTDTLSRLFNFCAKDPIPQGPLSKLVSMQVACYTPTGDPISIADANMAALAFFPRIEKFTCHGVDWNSDGLREGDADEGDDDEADDDDHAADEYNCVALPRAHSRPAMSHFGLLDSNPASFAELRDMLRLFPNLETLELLHPIFEDRENIDFAQYGQVLREFGKGLRRFELEPSQSTEDLSEECDEGVLMSLRGAEGLPALEQLRVPLHALVGLPEDGDEDEDLCRLLPASLRWLWTAVATSGGAEAQMRMLGRVLGAEGAREDSGLPRLEWVLLRVPWGIVEQALSLSLPEPALFSATRLGQGHVLFRKKDGEGVAVAMPPDWARALRQELGLEMEAGLVLPQELQGQRFVPAAPYGTYINPFVVEHQVKHWTYLTCTRCQDCPHGAWPCACCRTEPDDSICIVIAVDGHCRPNCDNEMEAAAGVFVGKDSPSNASLPLSHLGDGQPRHTKQTIQLEAAVHGLRSALGIRQRDPDGPNLYRVVIKSASEYLVEGIAASLEAWGTFHGTADAEPPGGGTVHWQAIDAIVGELQGHGVEVWF
ncbi:hypothetical protein Micbo1qcDRAFT_177473 [Microdochium bolleyi]|uniref:Uncharacterized protein n=1 Tax=Microdochium bolleyi TaxID=196109 RepID=A0A136IVN4_9PEZI|nr:hypothetical protein Micbo1qcDRAFT_177473 [Microdochium bolleyi]